MVILHSIVTRSAYMGPLFKFRRSTDDVELDFYGDLYGNLGTSYGATGTSFSSWIGTATAYVSVWYDQSGNGRHATQTETSSQPYYDATKKSVTFKPYGAFMNMPDAFMPTGNNVYSFVTKHGVISNNNGGIFGMGLTGNLQSINFARYTSEYYAFWYAKDITFGSYAEDNVICETYDQSYRRAYVNGILATTDTASLRDGRSSPAYLGRNLIPFSPLDGDIYYFYGSNMVLSDSDRIILENSNVLTTPPSPSPSMQPLALPTLLPTVIPTAPPTLFYPSCKFISFSLSQSLCYMCL